MRENGMRKILIFASGVARRYDFHGVRVNGNALLRRFIVGIAIVAALATAFWTFDAFAGGVGRVAGNHGRGHAFVVRGRGVFYVLPAYPYPLYAYPGSYIPPGYIPENYTYCDPNSGTYVDEGGARRLC